MEVLLVQATREKASPDRLIELVLQTSTPAPTNVANYRQMIVELTSKFAATAAMPLDVSIGDADNREGWESHLERLNAFMLLVEGATGETVHRYVRTVVPDLASEFEAKERA